MGHEEGLVGSVPAHLCPPPSSTPLEYFEVLPRDVRQEAHKTVAATDIQPGPSSHCPPSLASKEQKQPPSLEAAEL